MQQSRMKNWVLFFVIYLIVAGLSLPQAHANLSDNTRIFRSVSRAGAQATVGIYYDQSEYISYYGTGVIISADGYILTSTTVVPPGSEGDIEIHLSDHTTETAHLVESDTQVEASLLKVDGVALPHLPIARELPEVGERAYSFGNARHIMRVSSQPSFSTGRISGIYDVGSSPGLSSYEGLAIETDAAVNPGQDGGPLLNSHGQLAGIVSLSFSDARWLGVAVPITRICKALETIQQGNVNISHYPLVQPSASDVKNKKYLRQKAHEFSPAIVRLHVNRKYGPEIMPRYFLPQYLRQHEEEWEKADDRTKRKMLQSYTRAEKILKANQQIRRPNDTTTGVLISADGYILTSTFNIAPDGHFVAKDKMDQRFGEITYDGDLGQLLDNTDNFRYIKNPVEDVLVILDDGRSFEAEIVAQHSPLNVALLEIDAENLPSVSLPSSEINPKTGHRVALMGAKGAERDCTINTGIISAPSRRRGQFFQCTSMLNYANSGGPVVDFNGNLLGIATGPLRPQPITGAVLNLTQIVKRWQFAPNSGIGFVARIDHIREDLKILKSGESIKHLQGAFLGVSMDTSKVLTEGAHIGRVLDDSAAEKAGLEKGDQILAIDDIAIESWKDLTEQIMKYTPGDTAILRVKRKVQSDSQDDEDDQSATGKTDEYKTMEIKVTFGERK